MNLTFSLTVTYWRPYLEIEMTLANATPHSSKPIRRALMREERDDNPIFPVDMRSTLFIQHQLPCSALFLDNDCRSNWSSERADRGNVKLPRTTWKLVHKSAENTTALAYEHASAIVSRRCPRVWPASGMKTTVQHSMSKQPFEKVKEGLSGQSIRWTQSIISSITCFSFSFFDQMEHFKVIQWQLFPAWIASKKELKISTPNGSKDRNLAVFRTPPSKQYSLQESKNNFM